MRKRHVNSFGPVKSPLDWLITDCFAGGGGASTGIEMALGRSPDVAVNHNAEALAMHEANHPWTRHYQTDVRELDPVVVTRNRKVGLAWFSPDCTFFSKSRGGKPIRLQGKKVRGLAWVVVNWARKVRPRVIILENVEEFQDWGPVIPKIGTDGYPVFDDTGSPWYVPCPKRRGQTFRKWVRRIQALGGRVEWRELRGCDYGSPTIRKRLFVIIRFDNDPIVWPEPTHGKPGTPEVESGKRLPWRTAAEIIDWSIPCPSIFLTKEEGRAAGVNRPLKPNTMNRIAKGLFRYVINAKKPFIVSCNHGGNWFRGQGVDEPYPTATCSREGLGIVDPTLAPFVTVGQHKGANRSAETPLHTVTASDGDQNAIVAPILESQYGNSAGVSIEQPCPTVMAGGGGKTAVVAPFLASPAHSTTTGRGPNAWDIQEPVRTVTTSNDHCVVAPIIDVYHGPQPDGTPARSTELTEPLRTQDTSNRQALVQAFIAQHNGGMVGHHPEKPLSTVTTRGTQQQVVAATMVGCGERAGQSPPKGVNEPTRTTTTKADECLTVAYLSEQRGSNRTGSGGDPAEPNKTVAANGNHHAAVMAFLQQYYSTGGQHQDCRDPLYTIPTKARHGLVTVDEVEYQIVDIGMRMLTARELFLAQGFPRDYKIEVWCNDRRNATGKPMKPGLLTKQAQVKAAGNSVCPQLAAALVGANCAWLAVDRSQERTRQRQLELAGV